MNLAQGFRDQPLVTRSSRVFLSAGYDPSDPSQSWLLVAPINFWQCVPGWGFFLQMLGATAVMQRLLVTRKVWLFVPGLFCIFVLWVWFFISMRPTP
jgi:hypothetical protein